MLQNLQLVCKPEVTEALALADLKQASKDCEHPIVCGLCLRAEMRVLVKFLVILTKAYRMSLQEILQLSDEDMMAVAEFAPGLLIRTMGTLRWKVCITPCADLAFRCYLAPVTGPHALHAALARPLSCCQGQRL